MRPGLGQYENSFIGPGYPYGILSFNTYPGFSLGQRLINGQEATRIAKERAIFEKRRAATTDLPEFKYLTPDGLGQMDLHVQPLVIVGLILGLIWILKS